HKDHIGGIDDLRPFTFLHHQSILMYANTETIEGIRQEVPYMFSEYKKYINAADIKFFPIDSNTFFRIKDIPIMSIKIWHAELEILGFRIGDFTYITDCKTIEIGEQEKVKRSKYLVLNAVRQKPHYSHLNLEEAIKLSQSLQVGKTYFTHIGHEMGLHDNIQKKLPQNMYLAYDNLRLEIE
ncbi:MAG: MBL fold metallo-hydrolase, partial [Chitinophagaceae bacterium]